MYVNHLQKIILTVSIQLLTKRNRIFCNVLVAIIFYLLSLHNNWLLRSPPDHTKIELNVAAWFVKLKERADGKEKIIQFTIAKILFSINKCVIIFGIALIFIGCMRERWKHRKQTWCWFSAEALFLRGKTWNQQGVFGITEIQCLPESTAIQY